MRKTKEEAALTRQQLLKSALTAFSKKGYAATTLEDIARQAGVTRGAIYWHFGSKAELYNTLIRENADRSQAIVQKTAEEGGSLVDILRRVFVRLLEEVERDRDMRAAMELALFKTGMDPELEDSRQEQVQSGLAILQNLTTILHQGIVQGVLRADLEPADMARAYLALQNGLIRLWLTVPQEFSLKDKASAFADILLSGIQAEE